jgi:hypothetical protein
MYYENPDLNLRQLDRGIERLLTPKEKEALRLLARINWIRGSNLCLFKVFFVPTPPHEDQRYLFYDDEDGYQVEAENEEFLLEVLRGVLAEPGFEVED